MTNHQPSLFVLFTGHIRTPDLFTKSLELLSKNIKGLNIKKILFITWQHERIGPDITDRFKDLLTIEKYPVTEIGGRTSHEAQMFSYKRGLEFIEKSTKSSCEDLFILKTRPDVFIEESMLYKIVGTDLRIGNSTILSHKIWIPWAHKYKPFYIGDEAFFSHVSSMKELYNVENYFKIKKFGCGIAHISRFLNPFLQASGAENTKMREFCRELLSSGKYVSMGFWPTESYPDNNLEVYYEILSRYFVLSTESESNVVFRKWNFNQSNLFYVSSEVSALSCESTPH